jgi:hypothetical protein
VKTTFRFLLLLVLSFFFTNQLIAQPGRGLHRSQITRLYDASTEVTITGEITKIDTVKSGYGRFPGLLVTLKQKKQETQIYIAPIWYLDDQKLKFNAGKSLTVTGSRITYQNKKQIITRIFDYENKKITIRDKNGIPVWAGKRTGPGKGRRDRR